MDLIVSTPQGEAEISVNAVHESVTIADLLGQVLSSVPPHLVYIDGRPTPVGTLMAASGLVTGSVIEIAAPQERSHDGEVTLVQVAGEGGGNRRPLEAGRYALGTAQRANVAPLTFNQVLVARCEIVVQHAGQVTVAAAQGDLDGNPASGPAQWAQQHLRIGHRVFRLDGRIDDRAGSLLPTTSGQVNFTRQPRDAVTADPDSPSATRNGSRRWRIRRNKGIELPKSPPVASVDPARLAFDSELDAVRRAHLDLAEVIRRATQLSKHLWERRPTDDDAFAFSVGLADQRWAPADDTRFDRRDPTILPSVPVSVDLFTQRGIGFAGTPPQARAAARALVMQACVAHSPVDLDVVVLAASAGAARWEWVKWLPHARGSHRVQLLSDDEAISDWVSAQRTLTTVVASIQSLDRPITPSRLTLAVVDDPALWRGRAAMLRGLFAEAQLPIRFVAITDRADDVPAVCTTVVRIETNGAAEVDQQISGRTISEVVPFVLEHDVAIAAARRLSPLEDHGVQTSNNVLLPPLVSMASLIDPDGLDANRIVERWSANRGTHRMPVVLGSGEAGPVDVDLTEDGPHVLIVGAPRSGKTELIRTIIASLVTGAGPSALNVVCIEPSDGSSFGAFAGVDHVVGAVDNFDEHGGVRLLRALQSEVSRRARFLADSHAANFAAHPADHPAVENGGTDHADDTVPPIPRLLIAVDDADEVMARHPAFLSQLIELADRSRHLGLHLIVAAEQILRPIEHTLKSFANIRLGLRMNDPAEAIALMGTREAAQISLHTPGRGALKIGAGAALPVQFASVSAASRGLMEITPFTVARDLNAVERKIAVRSASSGDELCDVGGLRQLIDVVATAAAIHGDTKQPPVLYPDLPIELTYEQISSPRADIPAADGAAFALSDLPADRAQSIRRWNPPHDGNVLIIGGSPAERSSALATLFVAATDRYPTERLHGYVIDCAPGQVSALGPLESLPACGAVASPDDPDHVLRVLAHLDAELEHRGAQNHASTEAHLVLVVNDIASLVRTLEPGGEFEHGRDLLDRLVTNGRLHGITMLMSSASEQASPARMLGQFQQRIILHLDDRRAYRALGIESGRVPVQTAARAITTPDLVEIQIASITDLAAAVADRGNGPGSTDRPVKVARTPSSVSVAQVSEATAHRHDRWSLPVGLDSLTLRPSVMKLQAPGGALVLGDAGTGKSALLTNMARCALSIDSAVDIHAVAATWTPLLLLPGLTNATTLAGIDKWAEEFFARTERARLVFVDDADRLDGEVLRRLAQLGDPRVVVIAAGRTRELEVPDHWTAPLRLSRQAVILRPVAGDGSIFGLHLRVSSHIHAPDRGLLIDSGTTTSVLIPGPTTDAPGDTS